MNKEIIIQEIESLIRTLNFIQEEQSFIKNKLSIFLEKVAELTILNWAEILHQEILNRETAIQLLKNDILKLQNQVIRKKVINNILDRQIIESFKKFKQQVIYFETEFITWKNITNEQFEISL
jgi:hypothetical protein